MRVPACTHPPADALHRPLTHNPILRLLAGIGAALARWIQDRRMVAEIEGLDEATLRDIGVSREALLDHHWTSRTRARVENSLRRSWP